MGKIIALANQKGGVGVGVKETFRSDAGRCLVVRLLFVTFVRI